MLEGTWNPTGRATCGGLCYNGNIFITCGDGQTCVYPDPDDSYGYCAASSECAGVVVTTTVAPSCTNECSAGSAYCSSTSAIRTCGNYDADSCLEWSTSSCPGGATCEYAGATPYCYTPSSATTTTSCIPYTYCSGSSVYTRTAACETNYITTCGSGQTCSNGACVTTATTTTAPTVYATTTTVAGGTAVTTTLPTSYATTTTTLPYVYTTSTTIPGTTTPSCTSQCLTVGKITCLGSDGYLMCGNYDSDACLEWGSSSSCPAGTMCKYGSSGDIGCFATTTTPGGVAPTPVPIVTTTTIPAMPDLIVSNMTFDSLTTKNITVTITVKNIGNANADDSVVFMHFIAGSLGAQSVAFAVPTLAPGRTYYRNHSFLFTSFLPGSSYKFTAIADSQNQVSESNETNNILIKYSDVTVVSYNVQTSLEAPAFSFAGGAISAKAVARNVWDKNVSTFSINMSIRKLGQPLFVYNKTHVVHNLSPGTEAVLKFYNVTFVGAFNITAGIVEVDGMRKTVDKGAVQTFNGLRVFMVDIYQLSTTDQTMNTGLLLIGDSKSSIFMGGGKSVTATGTDTFTFNEPGNYTIEARFVSLYDYYDIKPIFSEPVITRTLTVYAKPDASSISPGLLIADPAASGIFMIPSVEAGQNVGITGLIINKGTNTTEPLLAYLAYHNKTDSVLLSKAYIDSLAPGKTYSLPASTIFKNPGNYTVELWVNVTSKTSDGDIRPMSSGEANSLGFDSDTTNNKFETYITVISATLPSSPSDSTTAETNVAESEQTPQTTIVDDVVGGVAAVVNVGAILVGGIFGFLFGG